MLDRLPKVLFAEPVVRRTTIASLAPMLEGVRTGLLQLMSITCVALKPAQLMAPPPPPPPPVDTVTVLEARADCPFAFKAVPVNVVFAVILAVAVLPEIVVYDAPPHDQLVGELVQLMVSVTLPPPTARLDGFALIEHDGTPDVLPEAQVNVWVEASQLKLLQLLSLMVTDAACAGALPATKASASVALASTARALRMDD